MILVLLLLHSVEVVAACFVATIDVVSVAFTINIFVTVTDALADLVVAAIAVFIANPIIL